MIPKLSCLLCLTAVLGAACAASDTYATGGTHSGGSNGKAAAATGGSVSSTTGSTSGTTTGSGASGSGATSSGSTGTTGCAPITSNPPLTDCPDGLIEVRSNLVDPFAGMSGNIGQGEPITATVAFQDLNNMSQPVVSGTCGVLIYCVPSGHVLRMQATVTGYVPMVAEDVMVTQPTYFQQIDLLDRSAASLLAGILQNYQATLPVVFVKGRNDVAQCPSNGWTFSLVEADDGGATPSEVAYFTGSDIGSGTETDGDGAAIFYNVQSPSGHIAVLGTLDPAIEAAFDLDAGVDAGFCTENLHSAAGFLGTAVSSPQYSMTFFPFELP